MKTSTHPPSAGLHTLFQKFDQLADVPDAVGKIRDLILELAVQGKLFGKAVELQADGLPNGWHQRKLGEVVQFINGDRSKNYPSKSFRVDSGIPFINAGHLSNGDVDLTDMNYITTEHFERLGGGKVELGDVLYCLRGSLGKCAVVQSIKRGAIASSLVILRPSQQVTSRFVHLLLTSPLGTRMISKYDNGSAQPNLSAANVKKYIIPLPPHAEQKRIVAKVDELMAQCDRLEAQLKERETKKGVLARAALTRFAESPTPEKLELLFYPPSSFNLQPSSFLVSPSDLRKTILTLAVQGKLVKQDPTDGTAVELLHRIDSARNVLLKDGIVPKQKLLAEIGEGECRHPIPETWQWIRLQRAAEIIDPNSSHRMPRYCALGVPFISTENFVGREEIDFSIGKQVDDAQLEEQKRSFNIRSGSFALSRIGTIGKTRMLPLERNYCMSHALVVIAPYSDDIDSKFLRMVVSSDAVQDQASHGAKSIGVPDLGMGKIRSFVIPLPPLAEQRRIVAKVDQLMALCDVMEHQITSATHKQTTLLAALMARVGEE